MHEIERAMAFTVECPEGGVFGLSLNNFGSYIKRLVEAAATVGTWSEIYCTKRLRGSGRSIFANLIIPLFTRRLVL